MKLIKKSLLALSILIINATTLPDNIFGDIVHGAGDIATGAVDVATLHNPAKEHEIRELRSQYNKGNISKKEYDKRMKELNSKKAK